MREIKSSKVKEKKAVSKKVDVMLGGRVGRGGMDQEGGPGGREIKQPHQGEGGKISRKMFEIYKGYKNEGLRELTTTSFQKENL